MDLPLPVAGLAAGALVEHAAREALADTSRLLQRVGPCAPELHDLRAVDQAQAVVGDHPGLALAPPRQRGGPLAGAPHLEDARQNAIVLQ